MDTHNTVHASRFVLKHVRQTTRSAVVDPGCQRCQQCLLRRFLPRKEAVPSSLVNQALAGRPSTQESHLCHP